MTHYESKTVLEIPSEGVKQESHKDGYTIFWFNNGDTRQIYPCGSKVVYHYKEAGITQTEEKDCRVLLFSSGQLEKHFNTDGSKMIFFADGSKKFIK